MRLSKLKLVAYFPDPLVEVTKLNFPYDSFSRKSWWIEQSVLKVSLQNRSIR
jgi:hypothetical protein